MKRLLNYFFVTLLISALSMPVLAQRYSNDWNRNQRFNQQGQVDRNWNGNRHQMKMARLDLTAEQQEQIDQLYLENQKEMLPLKNELREKKARLRTLNTSANYDKNAVNSLIDEIGELRTNMTKKRTAHRQEIRSLLTDEQRIIFDTRQNRKGGRAGMGMRGGNCGFGYRS